METKDARKLPPPSQEAIRKRAVQAVLEGQKQVEVARTFGVSAKSVNNWLKAYRQQGFKGLKAQKRGPKTKGALKPWQAAQIARTIKDKQPDQLHFPFHLWTRQSSAFLIESILKNSLLFDFT